MRVNVVLNRTVAVDSYWRFDNLCGSHLQRQSELYHVSWWCYTRVIDPIGQLRRYVIGRLSVKPWCNIRAILLQPYNIRVAHKPTTTLQRLLTNVKDKGKPEDRQGAKYTRSNAAIARLLGETGRNLSTLLTEHKRAMRNGDVSIHIAEHHLQTKHQFDWDSATLPTLAGPPNAFSVTGTKWGRDSV